MKSNLYASRLIVIFQSVRKKQKLSQAERNAIETMPRKAKRTHDVIDLTEDEPTETHRDKRTALGNAQPSKLNSHTAAYQSSSQNYPSSQAIPVIEPDVLDLTQDDDDGPIRELYGSFGGSSVYMARAH